MKERVEVITEKNIMPMIPVRDLVVFPGMAVHFDVGREMSMQSLVNARDQGGEVFLCAQKDVTVEDPNEEDIFRIGTIAAIKQLVRTPNGIYRCVVVGERRARLIRFIKHEDHFEAEIKKLPNYGKSKFEPAELEAVSREVINAFEVYAGLLPQMPKEIINGVIGAKDPISLFENIAFNIPLRFADRQSLLEAANIDSKLLQLLTILGREIEVISIEQHIHEQVQERIDENQREYYIREQIKVLQGELGENFDGYDENEIQNYYNKIKELNACDEVKEKLNSETKRLAGMPSGSQEAVVIRGYLDTVLGLPWGVYTKDTVDISKASKILEKDHYGLKKVKERILENIAVRSLVPDLKGQIICLAGPPGVGKTSVAKSVARALGRKFVRVSLGGVRDESDIRGHRKTYVGAMPGRILTGMRLAGSSNPVMLLDEIDKMGNDFRGDPSSAMLEVLDSEQNGAFRDHFAEVPYDLSSVLFITTANDLSTVAAPLRDRMEIIEITSYTTEEKFNIAKKHLVKKQMEKYGLTTANFRISNDGIYKLISAYTREAGVRELERQIATLCRKAARDIVQNGVEKVVFNAKNIPDYLGHEKYKPEAYSSEDVVGCVNGLAWTSVGGVIMPLEVLIMDGKGGIQLTGSLGDVMKESAGIAVSLTRSLASDYGIDKTFREKSDIHIHAPEGAVPKDGPSAGVTMVTGLVSALSGRKVRSDIAMTGEITLRGKVLPIGGMREKTMAAFKAGMTAVIVPEDNRGDMDEIDEVVKNGLEFIFVSTVREVLDKALIPPENESQSKVPLGMLEAPSKGKRAKITV